MTLRSDLIITLREHGYTKLSSEVRDALDTLIETLEEGEEATYSDEDADDD